MFSPDANQYYRFAGSTSAKVAPPAMRRLRGYAFDPSLSLRLETAAINHRVFEVPWEIGLEPGPVGEYVEVLDYDPASGCWYEPVDLNELELVAQDGHAPSEGNPQFHQQMAYAVVMNTIAHFEKALGRQIFWSGGYDETLPVGQREVFVRRLRVYPHALRAANAYYSPAKRALLFGYFQTPSGMVFSCLSHDIVAHETTHALLDGLHRRFIEENNQDSLAFHEAFADLVALFQHFTFPEVLRHQIAAARGDIGNQSLLGELAQQFGEATGRYGALRSAIGERDANGRWRTIEPDPERLQSETEPHARGAILVAAVFAAFVAANRARVRDLIRLATGGTEVLPPGALGPDLVHRLARETTETAKHFLGICIRALDYCPPVDLTFGDYLRALITADFDMTPQDQLGYRVALIESFRRWGILPKGLRTLSEDELRWSFTRLHERNGYDMLTRVVTALRPKLTETLYCRDREMLFNLLRDARNEAHKSLSAEVASRQSPEHRAAFNKVTGLEIAPDSKLEGIRLSDNGLAHFEVHALRPALRVTPDNTIQKQLVMVLTQRRDVPVDPQDPSAGRFEFRGGATLIFDLEGTEASLRYAIARPIDSAERLAEAQAYRQRQQEQGSSLRATYFGAASAGAAVSEPLALLHTDG